MTAMVMQTAAGARQPADGAMRARSVLVMPLVVGVGLLLYTVVVGNPVVADAVLTNQIDADARVWPAVVTYPTWRTGSWAAEPWSGARSTRSWPGPASAPSSAS